MAYIKLNHERVQAEMRKALMRPADLARRLKISLQLANFIIHHGGRKYHEKLANIFGCKREDLIIDTNPS